jgi:hypothetical protein
MPSKPDRRLAGILNGKEDILGVWDLVADGEVMHLVAERQRGEERKMWKGEA